MHFITLTFPGNPAYLAIREQLGGITGNLLYRENFETVDVVAFHPEPGELGRLHVHLLAWSREHRSHQAESASVERIKTALNDGRYGVGRCEVSRVSGAEQFVKVAAYLAWNYDQTLKFPRGPQSPIPSGARVLSVPFEVRTGQKWVRTGKFSFVTPATVAWRAAVNRYATANGRSHDGDWRWTWRERRLIREFLEPEQYRDTGITGLDGYTYTVTPYGLDANREETYMLSNEERGGFILTEYGLSGLAKFDVMSNTLPQNSAFDLTTGSHAQWTEVLGGIYFPAT
ncbi:MAG: hypothetical protein WCO60_18725 [Verrucomicrobiota bacterium]